MRLSLEQLERRELLSITVLGGTHYLLPNTPDQQIQVMVTGGDLVEALNFNAQIGDGGPEAGGVQLGPVITDLDIVGPGTVFGGNNTGQVDPETLRTAEVSIASNDADENPYTFAIQGYVPDEFPQFECRFTMTADGTVEASGVLAVLTIDTSGFDGGTWDLRLADTVNGPTDFADYADVTLVDGTLTINAGPVGVPDTFTGAEDAIIVGNVLANDSDPDGDPLHATLVDGPTHGTLAFADGAFEYVPAANYNGTDTFRYTVSDGHATSEPIAVTLTIEPVMDVLGRFLAYNNSYWDDYTPGVTIADIIAIGPSKSPLFDGQEATYASVTNDVDGITEVVFLVDDLGGVVPSASDFAFSVGNSNDTASWANAPAPLTIDVIEDFGDNGEDLVCIVWADKAIRNEWLRVEWAGDVHYWGSAPGDTGNSTTDFITDGLDIAAIKSNPFPKWRPADIDAVWDINRDSVVNATDMVLARRFATTSATALDVITPGVPSKAMARSVTAEAEAVDAVLSGPAPENLSLKALQGRASEWATKNRWRRMWWLSEGVL